MHKAFKSCLDASLANSVNHPEVMSLLYNLVASQPHYARRHLDLQAHGRDMAVYQKGIADPKSWPNLLIHLHISSRLSSV